MSFADRREAIGASASRLDTWPRRYGFALGAVSTAALVRYGVGTAVSVGATLPFIGFYPTIMLIALLVGFGPGLLATLASAAIAEYLHGATQVVRAQASASRQRLAGIVSGRRESRLVGWETGAGDVR